MSKLEELGIAGWPVADKLALLSELWDSLPEAVGNADVPDGHRAVIDRRRAEADENPGAGRPWRDVLGDIEGAG